MGGSSVAGRLVRRASEVGRQAGRLVRGSWREVRDENVTFMAGSIAYHAFVSMLPLLLFLLAVLSAVGTEAFTAALAEITRPFLTPYARRLLVESLDVATARAGVSVVGAITLLWGTSKIFRGLDVAFSEIYNSEPSKHLLAQFENAAVVFVALGVAVVVFLAAATAAAAFPELPYPSVLHPLFLVAGLALAFFPVYYVFPDVDVTALEVLPGVVVAAVGWAALEGLFQEYVTVAARYEAVYGTLGSVFLLLVWLYFGSLVLLVGGVVNAVLAGRTRDEHAMHVTEGVSADPEPSADAPERPPHRSTRSDPDSAGAGSAEPDGRGPERADRTDAGADLRTDPGDGPDADDETLARLVAENERLRAENDRLRAENRRLERGGDDSNRPPGRRRSVWRRAKRWLFDE